MTCNGSFTTTNYDPTRTAWTVGVNNELRRDMSVFGRIGHGIHFLGFGDLFGTTTGHTPPEQTINSTEVGLKYEVHWLYADVVAYRKIFSGLLYVPTNAQGVPLPGPPLVYGADSKGLNASVVITPIGRLRLQLIGNYLAGHYSHYAGCLPFSNVVTSNGCAVIEGRPLQRQPKLHLAFTPSYRLRMPWGDLTAFVTYTHVGSRTQDLSALQQLGTYDTLDFGVIAGVGANWEVRVQGTNLTNELGLTESTSTIFGAAPAAGGVILARTLEGREVNVELKYSF
jgi:outer membrane receptor protein involved in Fe transport